MKNKAIFGYEDYSSSTSYFDEHMYMFLYQGEIRNTIIDYKFNDKSYLYKTFVNFLKKNQKMCVQIKKYDIIIPVPISKKRKKQRGYNQSDIFAKEIAKQFDVKYINNVLLKIKDNKPQSLLGKEERAQNVQDSYFINQKEKTENKKILLIDDIFTTGNTVDECSKMLKHANAEKVGILTIAKD